MDKPSLTARQGEVLEFIRTEIRRHGRPPTVREIGSRFGMSSTGSVRDHLRALLRKGYVTHHRHRARGVGLATPLRLEGDPSSHSRGIPLLGAIAAGQPSLAEQNFEGTLEPGSRFAGAGVFALRIRGDSMSGAGILDGDYVFVRRDAEVKDRDIVAVLIDEEATVKRYFREGRRRIRLQPENPAMKPLYLRPSEAKVRLLGKVIGSMRQY